MTHGASKIALYQSIFWFQLNTIKDYHSLVSLSCVRSIGRPIWVLDGEDCGNSLLLFQKSHDSHTQGLGLTFALAEETFSSPSSSSSSSSMQMQIIHIDFSLNWRNLFQLKFSCAGLELRYIFFLQMSIHWIVNSEYVVLFSFLLLIARHSWIIETRLMHSCTLQMTADKIHVTRRRGKGGVTKEGGEGEPFPFLTSCCFPNWELVQGRGTFP